VANRPTVSRLVRGLTRACLNQHLIAIRFPEIHGDHVRSGTSLITIIYTAGHSHLLYKQWLTTDLAFGNSELTD